MRERVRMAPRFVVCAKRIKALPLTTMGETRAWNNQRFDWKCIEFKKTVRTLRGHIGEEGKYLTFKEEVGLEIYT